MRYTLLGKSGLRVSEFSLGTMTFGLSSWGCDAAESASIYAAYRDAGGNFLDTANETYGGGASEEILGRITSSHRPDVVLATKYGDHPAQGDPNRAGNHRKSLVQSLERSLRRLRTDYVDLLWLHAWDFWTPAEEVLRGLDDLVRSGKVLYVGISNTPAWIISRCQAIAELRGWTPFVATQICYNLIERTAERELLPMARELGLAVCAWSPLGNGVLTGKYTRPAFRDAPRRLDVFEWSKLDDRQARLGGLVAEIADRNGHTAAQVSLAWLRRRRVIPVIGVRTVEQLRENLGAADLSLQDEAFEALSAAARPSLGFPHDVLRAGRPVVYGGAFDTVDVEGRVPADIGGEPGDVTQ